MELEKQRDMGIMQANGISEESLQEGHGKGGPNGSFLCYMIP